VISVVGLLVSEGGDNGEQDTRIRTPDSSPIFDPARGGRGRVEVTVARLFNQPLPRGLPPEHFGWLVKEPHKLN